MDGLLARLASASGDLSAGSEACLDLLLADFLAVVVSARDRVPEGPFASDGVVGEVGLLALRSSVGDADDVDWISLHHPGSVIWPVVLAVGGAASIDGPTLGAAAYSGYRTAATVADALGPSHRGKWHVTATAGAFGATSAASVALGLSSAEHQRALALAAANVGGLSVAAKERGGAAAFNRVAAASLGVMAARAAMAGVPAVIDPIGGAGGVVEVMTSSSIRRVRVRDGVRDAAIRRYPTSGFLQSAVAESARLSLAAQGELVSIRVQLPDGVGALLDGTAGGPWWDGRLCVLRAWSAGSGFAATTPCALDGDVARVQLVAATLPPGHCRVTAVTDHGEYAGDDVAAPAWDDPSLQHDLDLKWSMLTGVDAAYVRQTARHLIDRGVERDELRGVWI